jgi:MFS family permease
MDLGRLKCGVVRVISRRRILSEEEQKKSDEREGQRGLITNRREAIAALLITTTILASALYSLLTRAPHSRWLFGPIDDPYLFGKSASIAISVLIWCFVAWILFCFYRVARDKHERFLLVGLAAGWMFSLIGGFASPSAQTNLEVAGIVAFLGSFASSLTMLGQGVLREQGRR